MEIPKEDCLLTLCFSPVQHSWWMGSIFCNNEGTAALTLFLTQSSLLNKFYIPSYFSPWIVPWRGWSHLYGSRKLGPRTGHIFDRSIRGQGRHWREWGGGQCRVQHHAGGGRLLPVCHSHHSAQLVLSLQVSFRIILHW